MNTDSAKNIRAGQAEEALIGLILMYEEFRREAAEGRVPIRPEDFFTEFGRRVFEEICRLERGEFGFSKSMLAERFSPEELGRIERMELDRRSLTRNDRDVFLALIETIKEEKSRGNDGDFAEELRRRQAEFKKKKENKNT